ncbi:MAG: S8 family serine peptidase, partial [Crocinitomicaceae bacterium]|nr:S8 family serine peptidase [Crocinitomicaceae bacterium]
MIRLSSLAFFVLLITSLNALIAQETVLHLKSGNYTITQADDFRDIAAQNERINDRYYRIVVFKDIPSEEVKRTLNNAGIKLLDYLPRNAFFASINASADWTVLDADDIVLDISSDYKLSANLFHKTYPHWTLFGDDKIELVASYYQDITPEMIATYAKKAKFEILSLNPVTNSLHIRIELTELQQLFSQAVFHYFACLPSPEVPENKPGRENHRSNTLWTEFDGGLAYRADGIKVMMQDDGYIGEHIDYTGRIDQSACSGCSWDLAETHGDHVAGTIMGAGNLDPSTRGMAHGAELLVYSSSNNNYNSVPTLYANDGLMITSKSYGNGCNGGYDNLTRQLDQQIRQMPSLIHVFSAGNSGAEDCGYGAGPGWGNITGGHKSGKNVIAVGNLLSTDYLSGSSSRGPATDGRIKPDICGVGTNVVSCQPNNDYDSFTGTSMSCPGVAGTVAQLYDGYKALNGGDNPNSGLIKASILNTGEDLGNYGPDFKFGWGRINARRAFGLLSNNQYIYDSLAQGGNDMHTINVPAGTDELRIMVYWSDYEGATNASIALVNDLNVVVTDPGALNYDPWVLDPTPTSTALNAPATRAVDDLNNMEQVTIINPVPGDYDISIDGFAVPQGPQKYHLVYYFVRDEITVTYPIGGEGISPSSNQTIRWDASEGTDLFTLEYTIDGGTTWTTIGTANASKRSASWSTPSVISGLAKVRVTRNAATDESDGVFSIIGVPGNVQFAWSCPDSLNLSWNAVSGATSYEVSMLGIKYMDSIGVTSQTNFTVPFSAIDEGWFSVKAFGPDNARSERAIAIQKLPGEFGCTWSSPYADYTTDCDNTGTGY